MCEKSSTEQFLLHPEIIAELKAIPQMPVKHEADVQANVIMRAQRQREEAQVTDGEDNESKGMCQQENESDDQSDQETSETYDTNRQENGAPESEFI